MPNPYSIPNPVQTSLQGGGKEEFKFEKLTLPETRKSPWMRFGPRNVLVAVSPDTTTLHYSSTAAPEVKKLRPNTPKKLVDFAMSGDLVVAYTEPNVLSIWDFARITEESFGGELVLRFFLSKPIFRPLQLSSNLYRNFHF